MREMSLSMSNIHVSRAGLCCCISKTAPKSFTDSLLEIDATRLV